MSTRLPGGEIRGMLDGKHMIAIPEARYWSMKEQLSNWPPASTIRLALGLSCKEKCGLTDQACVCDRLIRKALSSPELTPMYVQENR